MINADVQSCRTLLFEKYDQTRSFNELYLASNESNITVKSVYENSMKYLPGTIS